MYEACFLDTGVGGDPNTWEFRYLFERQNISNIIFIKIRSGSEDNQVDFLIVVEMISVGNDSELVVFMTAPDVLDEVRVAKNILSGPSVEKYLIRIDCFFITSTALCQDIP